MSSARSSSSRFNRLCAAPISDVPSLEDFLASRNIPTTTPKVKSQANTNRVPPPKSYISAYPIVDAGSFLSVQGQVGHKVELIGRIHAVKDGIGKRGKGRGRPYSFVNFGPWRGDIAKITIWSEGLAGMRNKPGNSWVGQWVSVIGLIDSPYTGSHYGHSYTHVGITVIDEGQIQFISAQEAKYRLGGAKSLDVDNRAVLSRITSGNASSPTRQTQAKPTNQEILQKIKASSAQKSAPRPNTSHQTYKNSPSQPAKPKAKSKGIPWWVWVLGAVILYAILKGHGHR